MKYLKMMIILITVIGGFLLLIFVIIPSEEKYNLTKQNSLQKHNKLLLKDNEELDIKLDSLQYKVDSLSNLILQDKQTILNLNQKLNEKITTIHHFSDDELYVFFSKFKTDSTAN